MIETISKEIWLSYEALLPELGEPYQIRLPSSLPYQGKIEGSFHYVPPEEILECIRQWASDSGDIYVYYFLTEYVQGDLTDYKITVSDLTSDNLYAINRAENVITNKDFLWSIFIDHEGNLHVSGPEDLFSRLIYCNSTIKDFD